MDLDQGTVIVRQSLERTCHGRAWALTEPETDRNRRTLSLPSVALVSLRSPKFRRIQQAEDRLRAGALWEGADDLVFTSEIGRPLVSSNVSRMDKALAFAEA